MPKPELKLAASESILKTEQNGGPMKAKFKKGYFQMLKLNLQI